MKKFIAIIIGVLATAAGFILTRVNGDSVQITPVSIVGLMILLVGAFCIFRSDAMVAFFDRMFKDEE